MGKLHDLVKFRNYLIDNLDKLKLSIQDKIDLVNKTKKIFPEHSDYLDGKIARAWNQESRLGELLDPAVDRLYIVATLITLYLKAAIPLWMLVILFGRDLYLGLLLLGLRRYGIGPFKVTYLGKAATFNLLYAFPILLLIKESSGLISDLAFIFGWSFSAWGIALYLLTAIQYSISGVKSALIVRKG